MILDIQYKVIQKLAHELKEIIEGMKYNNFIIGIDGLRIILNQYRDVNLCTYLQCHHHIIIRVFCSRAGLSPQTQALRLQFCSKAGLPL